MTDSTHSLDAIFKPKSIAVIGATVRHGTIGHELLHNIIRYGFNGMLFPVNPNYQFIHSIKCYPTVGDIPDPVDLAFIVVPKQHVLGVVEECGKKGVKGLVIISAGFREIGGEGIAREEALVEIVRKYGMRMVGPNCMGLINAQPAVKLNATFAPVEPRSGSLAFMTQSGALGVAILLSANKLNIGMSYFVSVGNKADVAGNDLLEYWENDEDTKVIALYLESFGEPRAFTEMSKRISRQKPVIVVKSGTTAAGARAASSHTGALAGLEIAVDALLSQCGVIRVSAIEQMMDLALGFTRNPIPRGNRVFVLTNAGGPGIMAADAIENLGLKMAKLSGKTEKKLAEMLPEESSIRNPVDMISGAGAEDYEAAMDLVLAEDGVDSVIVIFVPPIMIEPRAVVRNIAKAARRHDKPVFCVLMAEDHYFEELPKEIEGAPPLYRFPESAVQVIAEMNRYRLWCEKPEGTVAKLSVNKNAALKIVEAKEKEGGGYLSPKEVNDVLKAYGFPVCRYEMVPRDGDVIAAGDWVGYPLVLKAHGKDIIHKSDIGGVVVDIRSREELEKARTRMTAQLKHAGVWERVESFNVQEMGKSGKEVILGMTIAGKFGPVIMFGMGGKYVEIIKDITFKVMPITDVDAWDMVRGIKSYPLLEGVRGEEPVDLHFIVESIQRLGQLVYDMPMIAELDMNPVIVTPDRPDCRVVDARIRVEGGGE